MLPPNYRGQTPLANTISKRNEENVTIQNMVVTCKGKHTVFPAFNSALQYHSYAIFLQGFIKNTSTLVKSV
jgi:hypothetical protein